MTASAQKRRGIKASVWLEMRNNLITALIEVDEEITKALSQATSKRAVAKVRELLKERNRVVDELWEFGIDSDPHTAFRGQ